MHALFLRLCTVLYFYSKDVSPLWNKFCNTNMTAACCNMQSIYVNSSPMAMHRNPCVRRLKKRGGVQANSAIDAAQQQMWWFALHGGVGRGEDQLDCSGLQLTSSRAQAQVLHGTVLHKHMYKCYTL